MNSDAAARCRDYLDRLAAQIDWMLPGATAGYQTTPLPPERLPLVASLVRDYVEAEAVLAGMTTPPDETKNNV